MKVRLILLVLLFAAMSASPARATEKSIDKSFTITASSELVDSFVLLKIKFKDAVAQDGVCPYYIKNFNYDVEKKDLSLEVYKEFCVNDRFGQSQGVSYWIVPKTLVGSKLCVSVNQARVGSIVIEGNKKNYRIEKCE